MYDPLVSADPGNGAAYPDSYWAATAGPAPECDGPVQADKEVEVAIIGGGYTGLSAAYYLAAEQGIEATVLEANATGWGCSGRNGGFALKAGGRLSYQKMIRRYGETTARRMFNEIYDGLARVRGLINDHQLDCDQQPDGHLWVAHRPRMMRVIESEARFLKQSFDYEVDILTPEQLEQEHFISDEACGAMRFRHGFGVHPLKLAYGYHRLARAAGATIHTSSPVKEWRKEGDHHLLVTPGGVVKAKKVICATNGYTSPGLTPVLKNRTFPVLSNVIVTRPLTTSELQATNFISRDVITDTRTLRFYYRRLPDNRILIGGRSAISGADACNPKHNENLLQALKAKFGALQDLTFDYQWGGWVCVTFDDMPHIATAENDSSVLYAMGYGGSGVSFAVQAGMRLAEKVAGIQQGHDLPVLSKPLPKFPFASFRRIGQRALYQYYYARDERA